MSIYGSGVYGPLETTTRLSDVMLEIARLLGGVREGVADDGTTTYLLDAQIVEPAGHFASGTLWLLSGDHDGDCLMVTRHHENRLYVDQVDPAFEEDDIYAVAPVKFPLHVLKQSVNMTLRILKIPYPDATLTAESTGEIILTDVSDVTQVLIGDEGEEMPNYYWREIG